MLLFKKKFLDAIRDGRKTQTVRLWRACRFRAGQRSYIPGVGYIRITAVDAVRLEDLTDEDAVLDGFPSAAALLQEIRTLYADRLNQGYQAYRLRFQRVDETKNRPSREPKQVAEREPMVKRVSTDRREPIAKPEAAVPSSQLKLHAVRPVRNASSPQNPE